MSELDNATVVAENEIGSRIWLAPRPDGQWAMVTTELIDGEDEVWHVYEFDTQHDALARALQEAEDFDWYVYRSKVLRLQCENCPHNDDCTGCAACKLQLNCPSSAKYAVECPFFAPEPCYKTPQGGK